MPEPEIAHACLRALRRGDFESWARFAADPWPIHPAIHRSLLRSSRPPSLRARRQASSRVGIQYNGFFHCLTTIAKTEGAPLRRAAAELCRCPPAMPCWACLFPAFHIPHLCLPHPCAPPETTATPRHGRAVEGARPAAGAHAARPGHCLVGQVRRAQLRRAAATALGWFGGPRRPRWVGASASCG